MNADPPKGPSFIDYRARLQRLFAEVYQLRSLSLADTSPEMKMGSLLASGISNHRFQLSELSISLSPELSGLLASQPSLRRLVLHNPFGDIDPSHLQHLHPDSLPHLDAVSAHPTLLPILLKQRCARYVAAVPLRGIEEVNLLWDAIREARMPPSSLTVAPDSPITFRAFMDGVVTYLPELRFLGVACMSILWAKRQPPPIAADLIPLRRLAKLEAIQWSGRFLTGNSGYPPIHLLPQEWHPSSYAGPALCYVQHEMEYSAVVRDPQKEEGYWKRPDLERDGWEVCNTEFSIPRLDIYSAQGLLVCLIHLRLTPYILQP
ncbi:hypothetical protein DL93DRAFT_2076915 [Clavulina sp. PMI_390]|nr:hypothetical protein DL93DRAFT_2076915 [Clavulina sp. PMI_390]